MSVDVDSLLAEAERQPFLGWDFSWLAERRRIQPVPWDFAALVAEQARQSPDLLDMGTGGGEWLSGLPHLPRRTVAIEGWAPNVPIAARRLRQYGAAVIHAEGARDNVSQQPDDEPSGRLPFRDGSFHLISNRHEAYVAAEVERVLAPGGLFLTQQVGAGAADDFCRLLDVSMPPPPRSWGLALAVAQVEAAGLNVVASGEGVEQHAFADIGALAWYLKAIPWTVPGFSIEAFRPCLAMLHERIQAYGPLVVRQPLFWLAARTSLLASPAVSGRG